MSFPRASRILRNTATADGISHTFRPATEEEKAERRWIEGRRFELLRKRRKPKSIMNYNYDVFLCHSSKDKPVVRQLAERLKADGVCVWFDEWEIRPGDSIPKKIEEGLNQSRTLILFMSANAFGSDWVELERDTVIFRDPTNKERRFVPLRLDDAQIPPMVQRFQYVDWRSNSSKDTEYEKLLELRKPPANPLDTHPLDGGKDVKQIEPPVKDFIGRASEISEIAEHLNKGHFRGVIISGEGGVGKTELARALAKMLQAKYPVQFYFNMRGTDDSPASAADAMEHILRSLEPTVKPPSEPAELRQLLFSSIGEKRVVLLLDNASDLDQVESLVSSNGSPNWILLVTSRTPFEIKGLYPKNLVGLSKDEASRLLRHIAPSLGSLVEEIAKCCGYLPLALRVVGGCAPTWRPLILADLDCLKGYAADSVVGRAFHFSYECLEVALRSQWCNLALIRGRFRPEIAAALWGLDSGAAQMVLELLRSKGLVEQDWGSLRFHLHDLARSFLENHIDPNDRHAGCLRMADYYREFIKNKQTDLSKLTTAYDEIDAELPNIRHVLAWCFKKDPGDTRAVEAGADILLKLSRFLRNRGYWKDEENVMCNAIQQSYLPASSRIRVLCHLAWVRDRLNRQKEAMASIDEADAHAAEADTFEHGLIAQTQGQIAFHKNDFFGAEEYLKRALKIYEGGTTDELLIGRMDVLDSLGDLNRNFGLRLVENNDSLSAQRHFKDARQFYLKLLDLANERNWAEKRATATGDLGHVALYLGLIQYADEWLRNGLRLAQKIHRTHTVAYCYLGLGELLAVSKGNQRQEALDMLAQALTQYQILGRKDVIDQIETWRRALQTLGPGGVFKRPPWVCY